MYHLTEDQVLEVLIQMEVIEQFHYERQSNLNEKFIIIKMNVFVSIYIP
jgi:hypothetical protein